MDPTKPSTAILNSGQATVCGLVFSKLSASDPAEPPNAIESPDPIELEVLMVGVTLSISKPIPRCPALTRGI